MSFTTQVVPIGTGGVSPTPQTEIDPIYVSAVGDLPAGSIGSEGSTDDPQEVFPDTFVDMAKETEEQVEKDPPRKKKKYFFKSSNKKKGRKIKNPEETNEEMPEEVL